MTHWLVLWKTWLEEEIETPWPFVVVDRTADFKNRETSVRVPQELVDSIFLSFDVDKVHKFQSEHVYALVLSCVLEAADQPAAVQLVQSVFPDAEVTNCALIPLEMLSTVMENFSQK